MHKLFLSTLLIALTFSSHAASNFTESELRAKTEAFINAKNARQQPNTTVKDVDYYISLLADDFVDEHVKFEVTITDKNELRKGMIAKMEDEVYFCEIKIDEMMFGSNVTFVKYTEHAKVKPGHLDKVIEYTSTNLLSLEFNEDGLIKHIRRHHGL